MGRRRRSRQARRMAVVAVAVPMAAWGLEQAAQRLEGRNPGSMWPGRLRQGADWLGGLGQGPLADRLRRPTTTVTRITKPDDRPASAEVMQ
jgi:hypothetical protein